MFQMRSAPVIRGRLWLFFALMLVAFGAHADYVYGPPYDYNTAVGTRGGFLSVDAAVGSFIADNERFCNGPTATCKPHSYSVDYSGVHSGTAATVFILYVLDDGSTSKQWGAYIYATDVTGAGFQAKNAGGCRTMCTGGNGKSGDALGPRASSQEGMTKIASDNVGTSLEGDPINAANGNEYRQDTDLSSSRWLTFRRFYNSSSYVVPTTMGPKWRHSFDRTLTLMPSSSADAGLLYARRPDGSMVSFSSTGGVWKADSDAAETLAVTKDATTGVTTGYTLRVAATRETESYDATGRLLSITDDNGWATTLAYSDATTPAAIAPKPGFLIGVTDPQGRVLHLTYDGQGRLAQVADPAGQTASYAYADNGNLANVTFADGSRRQYLYSEPANTKAAQKFPSEITGVIDEKGKRFETTTFDDTNHALTSQFAGGADKISLYYYNYSDHGGIPAQMTTPLGLVVLLGFADDGAQSLKPSGTNTPCGNQCNQPWKSVTYDAHGYPATSKDFLDVMTTSTYDANGLLTQQVEASGTPLQRTTVTTWDTLHRQPLTRVVSDAKGTVVARNSWTYNARGQALAECAIDPAVTASYACGSQANAPAGIRQTSYSYCDAVDTTQCPQVGLLLTVDGPRTDVADVTHYAYYVTTDESGCAAVGGACHRAGDLAQVTDALGHVRSILAYDRHGRPVRQKDANGVITDVAYTPRGWLASRTVRAKADGSASADDATTTLTYEATGALKTVTDPDGVVLTMTYDDAHRLIEVTDAQGNHVHYTLDANGNRIKEETFDAQGVSRRSMARKYNTLGQLTQVTDGRGHVVFDATASGSYDGNGHLLTAKDALGTVQKDSYDALNRLVTRVADVNGASAATKATTTAFAFDALDQLTGITDPEGLTTTYRFDGLQNPVGQTSPDTGTQSATFDAAGHPLTMTDAKGTVVSQVFDALGRTTAASYADATLNTTDRYDEADSVTGCQGSFPQGRLTRRVESTVTTAYCYDRQGRLAEQRQTQGASTDVTDYVYTRAGRLAAIASPSGLVTEYGRDALGQIVSVTVTPAKGVAAKVVTAASYLPFGPITSYTLGNGQTVIRTYDANYQVTDVTSPALNLHFARDAAGNLTGLGDGVGATPTTETYTYDPLYRLAGVKDPSGKAIEAYTYNRTGDRLTKAAPGLATGTYGYQAGTHWLTGIGTASRTYDANGSTTANAAAGVAWGYGYNGRGQLTVLQQGGSTIAMYGYNAGGQRVLKTVGAAQTRFAYGPSGLLGEYGSSARDYVWLDTVPLGVVDGSGVSFIHADGLNTPRSVTDGTGSTLWSWAFKSNPFGEVSPTSSNGYVLNLRFPGQYADAESGLIYNLHRYYDPATGRYLQSDPTGLNGGSSTYAYVSSGPLGAFDSQGLQEENERELFEPVNVAGAINQANYRIMFSRIRQVDPNFQDPIASPGEIEYTRQDVERLEEAFREKMLEGCPAPRRAPDFIVTPSGTAYPVPRGATGPEPANNGRGFQFQGGAGGNGLDGRVSGFRFMDPVMSGPYSYPNGYGSYNNSSNQTVNPYTGSPNISKSDPMWHIAPGK